MVAAIYRQHSKRRYYINYVENNYSFMLNDSSGSIMRKEHTLLHFDTDQDSTFGFRAVDDVDIIRWFIGGIRLCPRGDERLISPYTMYTDCSRVAVVCFRE